MLGSIYNIHFSHLQGDCSSVQSFTDLIFQPPKVGPIELGDDDLIAVYEPTNQSVKTVTRKEFNQMKWTRTLKKVHEKSNNVLNGNPFSSFMFIHHRKLDVFFSFVNFTNPFVIASMNKTKSSTGNNMDLSSVIDYGGYKFRF